VGLSEASRAYEDSAALLLLHVRYATFHMMKRRNRMQCCFI